MIIKLWAPPKIYVSFAQMGSGMIRNIYILIPYTSWIIVTVKTHVNSVLCKRKLKTYNILTSINEFISYV